MTENGQDVELYLELLAEDGAGLVGESHITDLSGDLQGLVQNGDHGVQTVGNQANLSVEGSVGGQVVLGNIVEVVELGLEAGVSTEEPDGRRTHKNISQEFKQLPEKIKKRT